MNPKMTGIILGAVIWVAVLLTYILTLLYEIRHMLRTGE